MIDAAATDPATLKAVADVAKKTNPDSASEIDAQVAGIGASAEAARVEKLSSETFLQGWKGSGEIGIDSSTGNTKEAGIAVGITLNKESLHWRHALNGIVDYRRTNNVTSKDRYFGGYEGNYKITPRFFALAVLSYDQDRFAGYNRRFAEGLGLGYSIIDTPTVKLNLEAGPALRQTKYITGVTEDKLAGRVAGKFAWTITPTAVFSESASAYLVSGSTSFDSVTAITGKLAGALSARASLTVHDETQAPLGRKPLDTTSRLTLEYGF